MADYSEGWPIDHLYVKVSFDLEQAHVEMLHEVLAKNVLARQIVLEDENQSFPHPLRDLSAESEEMRFSAVEAWYAKDDRVVRLSRDGLIEDTEDEHARRIFKNGQVNSSQKCAQKIAEILHDQQKDVRIDEFYWPEPITDEVLATMRHNAYYGTGTVEYHSDEYIRSLLKTTPDHLWPGDKRTRPSLKRTKRVLALARAADVMVMNKTGLILPSLRQTLALEEELPTAS